MDTLEKRQGAAAGGSAVAEGLLVACPVVAASLEVAAAEVRRAGVADSAGPGHKRVPAVAGLLAAFPAVAATAALEIAAAVLRRAGVADSAGPASADALEAVLTAARSSRQAHVDTCQTVA
jgi:CBS domain containing-hemolysin-like protein